MNKGLGTVAHASHVTRRRRRRLYDGGGVDDDARGDVVDDDDHIAGVAWLALSPPSVVDADDTSGDDGAFCATKVRAASGDCGGVRVVVGVD